MAANTIGHGEELYTDYLTDQRMAPGNIEYAPDWLLEPPPASPYLFKKEYTARVPYLVKVLHSADIAQLGRKFEEFDQRTMAELPAEVEERKMGRIKAKLERQKQIKD